MYKKLLHLSLSLGYCCLIAAVYYVAFAFLFVFILVRLLTEKQKPIEKPFIENLLDVGQLYCKHRIFVRLGLCLAAKDVSKYVRYSSIWSALFSVLFYSCLVWAAVLLFLMFVLDAY